MADRLSALRQQLLQQARLHASTIPMGSDGGTQEMGATGDSIYAPGAGPSEQPWWIDLLAARTAGAIPNDLNRPGGLMTDWTDALRLAAGDEAKIGDTVSAQPDFLTTGETFQGQPTVPRGGGFRPDQQAERFRTWYNALDNSRQRLARTLRGS